MKRSIEPLTAEQRTQILKYLATGGDLSTVCQFAGVTEIQLQLEMKRDPDFALEVAREEATVELRQMGNVVKAAQDEKNWRTSVWWIERRTRQRLRGKDGAMSEADLLELLDELAAVIVEEISDPAVQRRVIERLLDVVARDAHEAAVAVGAMNPLQLALDDPLAAEESTSVADVGAGPSAALPTPPAAEESL